MRPDELGSRYLRMCISFKMEYEVGLESHTWSMSAAKMKKFVNIEKKRLV